MTTLTTCTICNTTYDVEPIVCSKCDYPFSASEEEKSTFVGQLFSKKLIIQEARVKVKNTQKILWAIGGVNVFYFIILFSFHPTLNIYILDLLLGFVFIGFGFYAAKKPFRSILISLILLLGIYVSNALVDPISLFRGIIFKVIFVVGLIYGLLAIYQVHKIKNKNEYFKEIDW
ncbi:MAG: hypothetical protein ISP66_07360 [Flavobacteriaceae bacterium]|nr:hypothetical protein [Flavobacteriaceae bacterium]MDB2313997.1 hypothetical protein [Flavobacteriaceae bacterium]MDC3238342.1 hypothetical protein [Flavobacteriaceae bacterium]